MRTRTRMATACAATAVLTVAFTGQASAADATASCSTTGASGGMSADYPSGEIWPYLEFGISLSVTDTLADGHHVRVRLITKEVGNSAVVTWKWHSLTTGKGETLTLSTTARDEYGIEATGVEVARFEGDEKLNYCRDWS